LRRKKGNTQTVSDDSFDSAASGQGRTRLKSGAALCSRTEHPQWRRPAVAFFVRVRLACRYGKSSSLPPSKLVREPGGARPFGRPSNSVTITLKMPGKALAAPVCVLHLPNKSRPWACHGQNKARFVRRQGPRFGGLSPWRRKAQGMVRQSGPITGPCHPSGVPHTIPVLALPARHRLLQTFCS